MQKHDLVYHAFRLGIQPLIQSSILTYFVLLLASHKDEFEYNDLFHSKNLDPTTSSLQKSSYGNPAWNSSPSGGGRREATDSRREMLLQLLLTEH